MGEIVRYSIVGHGEPIKWPQRCPCCGGEQNLTYSQARAARESISGLSRIRLRTEWYDFSILTCRDHAFSNWLGGKILEKTTAATVFRSTVYFCLFLVAVMALQFATGMRTWHETMAEERPRIFFLVVGTIGALGLLLILWAKSAAKVYVMKLDKDQNVAILHFSSEKYAREFKRVNMKATSRRLADSMPFFMRPSFIKFALIAGVILLVGAMVGR